VSGFKQRCHVRAAKPAVGTNVSLRLAAAVLCRAAGWRPVVTGRQQRTAVPLVEKELDSQLMYFDA